MWSCIRPFQLLVYEILTLQLCLLSAILLGKYDRMQYLFSIEEVRHIASC